MMPRVIYLDGGKIKRVRLRRGLTQRDLSERSGVAQSTISALEKRGRNERFYPSTVTRLADALEVDPDDLLAD
jgi:transcriptional regulator with XRE-family HTH domain